jgi:hypothetical protein
MPDAARSLRRELTQAVVDSLAALIQPTFEQVSIGRDFRQNRQGLERVT